MYILGIDTTQAACSAAVFCSRQNRVVSRVYESMQRGHAEALADMVATAMRNAGITLAAIDRFAVTTGPGTFTGVRIGLAAARGFALALDKPLVGISSLEAIARSHGEFEKGTILAAFDARRHEVYVQLFSAGQAVCEPQLRNSDNLGDLCRVENTHVVGTATGLLCEKYPALICHAAPALPDAAVVARVCAGRAPQNDLQPLYLRRADAKAQTPLITVQPSALFLARARPEHARILSALHAHGFNEPWSEKVMADTLQVPGTGCQMAFEDRERQTPVGFIMYRDAVDEREILSLCVATNARRRNVAGTLLATIASEARQTGIKKIFLEVSVENQAARKLYEKHDFATCGTRPGYYQNPHGENSDGLIMVQIL